MVYKEGHRDFEIFNTLVAGYLSLGADQDGSLTIKGLGPKRRVKSPFDLSCLVGFDTIHTCYVHLMAVCVEPSISIGHESGMV